LGGSERLERYKRSRWKSQGFDVDDPRFQRILEEHAFYPETTYKKAEELGLFWKPSNLDEVFLQRVVEKRMAKGLPPAGGGAVGPYNARNSILTPNCSECMINWELSMRKGKLVLGKRVDGEETANIFRHKARLGMTGVEPKTTSLSAVSSKEEIIELLQKEGYATPGTRFSVMAEGQKGEVEAHLFAGYVDEWSGTVFFEEVTEWVPTPGNQFVEWDRYERFRVVIH
jgi:hypothetical protein